MPNSIGNTAFVRCREVVRFSEGPLSEARLYVHGHHSVWVTDAWSVLQAICQGEIYTNIRYVTSVTIAFILFSPQNGDTALHKASRYGHPEVVKLLLQSHADVNVKDNVSTKSPR